MAILASNYMTLADVMKQSHNGDIESDIVEIMSESDDIIKDAHFKECNDGTNNITVIRSGLPDATFRALYGFVPTSKSETQQVKDNTGMLEAYSVVDVDLVDKAKNPNQVRLNEAKAFIEAMGQKIQKTVIYGSKTGDEKAFDGLAVRYDHISTDKNNIGYNVVDGGGKGTKNTSVWFICWGESAVSMLYPQGSKGGLQRKDQGQVTETNQAGAKREAFVYLFTFKNLAVIFKVHFNFKNSVYATKQINKNNKGRSKMKLARMINTQSKFKVPYKLYKDE